MTRYAKLLVTSLSADDPGESAEDFQRSAREQDDAFCNAMTRAMTRAIARGREKDRGGVQTKPIDGVLRIIRGETHVFGSSPAHFV